ncbi:MAG: hypothetical protein U1D30_08740 [Planctomycetota bacterium]
MSDVRRYQIEDYTDPDNLVVCCRLSELEECERVLREHQTLHPDRRFRVSYIAGMRKINKYYPAHTRSSEPLPAAR